MRKIATLAASALVLALGVTSAFAVPSGDIMGQEQGIVSSFGAHNPDVYTGHNGYGGYHALAPDDGYNAGRYNRQPQYLGQ